MDCEKFDQHVMDALYDELDELTYAAMKRHMEGCARCASAFSGLRAARDAGSLPIEEPSETLEARILEAVEVAQKKTPFRRKALRALAWAGSHAMRPQLAMAALFVLVIGSSLLLLRPKTGVAPVRVTEWGQPASDQHEAPSVIAPAAAPAAAEEGDGRRLAEAKASEPPRAVEATKEKSARGAAAPEDGASAALRDAQALQRKSGCAAAVGKLDEIGARHPGTPAAHAAMWEAARCHQAAGDTEKARELLLALRSARGYGDRAEQMLAGLEADAGRAKLQNAAPAATTGATAARRAAPMAPGAPTAAPAAPPAEGDARPPQAAPPATMSR